MVIARFSWIKAGVVLCLLLLLSGLLGRELYQHNLRSRGFWLALVALPVFLTMLWVLLRELLFHGARAIWLEDGVLNFVPYDPSGFKSIRCHVPVQDIQKMRIGRLNPRPSIPLRGIFLTLRSGEVKDIPAYLYSESIPVVFARLNQILGFQPIAESVPDGAVPESRRSS